MGRYNKNRFQQVMLQRDLVAELKSIKQSAKESISEIIRRLLQAATNFTKKDEHTVAMFRLQGTAGEDSQDLWRSELFA